MDWWGMKPHDLYCSGSLEGLYGLVGHDLYCYGSLEGLHGLVGHDLYCYGSLEWLHGLVGHDLYLLRKLGRAVWTNLNSKAFVIHHLSGNRCTDLQQTLHPVCK